MRIVISLLLAVVGSIAGVVLLSYGGGYTMFQLSRFGAEGGAGAYPLLIGLGVLLLAAAAFSVRWSPVGIIVVGAAHVLFSLLAILVPFSPLDGVQSPAVQLLNALFDVDQALAAGAFYFVSFGGGALIGFALLGAGLLARRARPGVLWRVLSAIGGLIALGPAVWAFAAGGDFYRRTFQLLAWDAVTSVVLVVAALLFGVLLAPSGRSAIGAWIAGGVLSVVGVILLVADPVAYAGLPAVVQQTLPTLGWTGTIVAVGVSLLGLALGVTLRPASAPLAPDGESVPPASDAASAAV